MRQNSPTTRPDSTADSAARLHWWLARRGERIAVRVYGAERGGTVAAIRTRSERQHELDPDVLGPPGDGRRGGGAPRGDIGEYSAASRRRLREAVWAVQPAVLPRRRGRGWVRPSSFVTLTYPAQWDPDPRRWKRDLATWFKQVVRRWPSAWAIWALEIQQRGAPHFHLLVRWPSERGPAGWRARQEWLSRSWAEVVAGVRPGGEVDRKHLKAGTNLRPLVTSRALAEYVAKPGSKRPPDFEASHGAAIELSKRGQRAGRGVGQGRWWGIANRAAYRDCAVVVEAALPAQTAARIAVELESSWRAYAQRTGGEWEHWPRWASGRHVREVLDAAGATGDLFAATWIDVATGELLGAGALTEADFGAASRA